MHAPQAMSSSHRQPFGQEPDPEVFFPGAQREEICQALILDLLTGKQFLHLSGDTGSGKSLICQVIMERLPATFTPVYLAEPTGSYEDIIRHASLDLGAPPSNKPDDFSWPMEFNRQLMQRQGESGRIVLILDQAEQMFAATLERLLQRTRQRTAEEPAFTVLLAGAPGLNGLLSQLATLGAENIPEASYVLPPLDLEETEKYLRYRLHAAQIPWDEHDRILNKKIITRIFKSAQGNCALTNNRAAAILSERLPQPAPAESEPATCDQPLISIPVQEEPNPWPEHEHDNSNAEVVKQKLQQLENQISPPLVQVYELLTENRKLLGSLLAVAIVFFALGLMLALRQPATSLEQTTQAAPAGDLPAQDAGNTRVAEATAKDIEEQARLAESVMEISPQPSGARLLQERLAASTSLVAAAYRGASTIQVLSVSGSDAEEEMVKLLNTPLFSQQATQLYIVRKRTSTPVYFIFYGIYDTLEQARQARNNMSFELRAHHPYPLAISDALLLNEG